MQHGRLTIERLKGHSVAAPPVKSECRRALLKLEEVVLNGLRHGFCEITLSCQTTKEKKRRLVITAGNSYQFTIPIDDIEEFDACA